MESVTHEIDPDADTVITLRNASVDFAPWEKQEAGSALEEDGSNPGGSATVLLRAKENWTNAWSRRECLTFAPLGTQNAPCVGRTAFGLPTLQWDFSGTKPKIANDAGGAPSSSNDSITSTAADDKPDDFDQGGVHFRVSSRHLVLASKWFQRALSKDGWSESSRSLKDGLFHVDATDWDEEAFLIFLNILHLRNRMVPRKVSLEMLAKIAVLIDYYECGEALELFTETWIESLKASAPEFLTYDRNLVLWIWVSWAFDLDEYFEHATEVAIEMSPEPFRDLGLPIPSKVSRMIDLRRCQAIEGVVGPLHSLREQYCSVEYICPESRDASLECGCMLLGALTKELGRNSLLSPRPKAPFAQLSANGVWDVVENMQSPKWFPRSTSSPHGCNLKAKAIAVVEDAKAMLKGVNLKEIKHNITWEQEIRAEIQKRN